MKSKYTNSIIDLLDSSHANRAVMHMWGAEPATAMGDGIKIRITKSPLVDFVYIRYEGFHAFEVEFGALVGNEYDVLDRIASVAPDQLMSTISKKVFGFNVAQTPTTATLDGLFA